ncbi:hypothetical protein GCM10009115_01130 [Sphingopyxis soli]|uniref:Uncharacterized protein n=2 Tax=Sphingopyxis soli TaxID=592051 RepID=A0ABN1LVN6_9SPHN
MRIGRKRVRNIDLYWGVVPEGEGFRLMYEIENPDELTRMGLSEDPGAGETILPSIVGPISRFNAEGRWIARRDLPREMRYIRTISWSWTTWDGTEHTEHKDITRLCYQRDLVSPPSVELTYVENDTQRIVMSDVLYRSVTHRDRALHTINLFLELFGSCEIATVQLDRIVLPAIRKANWKLLPTGKYPWEQIQEHVDQATARMNPKSREIVLDRQKALEDFGPDERWVGEGGFDDYMAYVFRGDGIIVLESLRRDNAIYVFTGDWRPISKLTKGEILRESLHHARIVHSEGWKGRLAALFRKRAA